MSLVRVLEPPLAVWLNQACYYCHKDCEERASLVLKRCSGCRHVSYCSEICQNESWPLHKVFCRALTSTLSDEKGQLAQMYRYSAPLLPLDQPTTDFEFLGEKAERRAGMILSNVDQELGKHNEKVKRKAQKEGKAPEEAETVDIRDIDYLVWYEPKCLVCARTDQDLLREFNESKKPPAAPGLGQDNCPTPTPNASSNEDSPTSKSSDCPSEETGSSTPSRPPALTPCPACNTSFFCCPAHLTFASAAHLQTPYVELLEDDTHEESERSPRPVPMGPFGPPPKPEPQPGQAPKQDRTFNTEGLSHCAMNARARAHLRFIWRYARALQPRSTETEAKKPPKPQPHQIFKYVPTRRVERYEPLEKCSWDDYQKLYAADMESGTMDAELAPYRAVGYPDVDADVQFRASTDSLSMALTILWALEITTKMRKEDGGWTRAEKITVEIVGANQEEHLRGHAFEEILHRLPHLKHL